MMASRPRRGSDECAVPPLEIGVQAIQLSPYRAGLAGRHPTRLPMAPASPTCSCPLRLSPSGESDDPEASLRTSPDCVRDSAPRPAAHAFTAPGLAPAILLRDPHAPRSVPSHFLSIPRAFPADSLRVRCVPLFQSFRRLGAFAVRPHPGVRGFPTCRLLCPIRLSPRTSSFRVTLPSHYFPTALGIPRGVSRVHRGGLKRDEVGGVLLCVPSALCGSPG